MNESELSEGKEVTKTQEEDGPEDCVHCETCPCVAKDLYHNFSTICLIFEDSKTNKQLRFLMYREATKVIHGPGLGKGVRKKIPSCVQVLIKELAPDESYTGFLDAGDCNETK